jgi:hypothetical protein
MPWVGFESTIPMLDCAKSFPALDRAVTVIGALAYTDIILNVLI